ncbi:MAG: DUF2157 domain-containing protein [Alphaproteobacteria bacterium]|nr:DUF2157 domain-containing protein [Alphaproteobacteria bacterium]
MRLHKKLNLWEKNQLISSEQKQKILNFEKNYRSPILFSGFIWLGIFVIALGFISIVAANWMYIPGYAKIFADFMFLGAVACATYRAYKNKSEVWFEGGMLALYMLSAASIGLIGQVFQTNGSFASFGFFWSLITFPMLLVSKRKIIPALWLIVFISSFGFIENIWDIIEILFWWCIHVPLVQRIISAFLLIGALAYLFDWAYKKTNLPIFDIANIYANIALYINGFYCLSLAFDYHGYFWLYYPITVAFLIIMAVISEKLGNIKKVNFNIVLLYICFIVLYFDLVGSLISTSLGLIVSGGVIIGGVYLVKYTIRKLKIFRGAQNNANK